MEKRQDDFTPSARYRRMLAKTPVWHNTTSGMWEVYRYNDVSLVLTQDATCSAEIASGPTTSFNFLDPPQHGRLHMLVAQAFNEQSVARLASCITTYVQDLLDRVASRGGMDIVADFAYPLPLLVLGAWLGIPACDYERFRSWSTLFVTEEAFLCPPDPQDMRAYFLSLIEQRRQRPQDDLISGLVLAEVGGQHLTDGDILNVCRLLLIAGNDTTTNLIGNALFCFLEYGMFDQLRADLSLLPGAIEEVLRYRPPVPAMFRIARRPLLLGGQRIQQGDTIMAWIGSANRDEQWFPDAEKFDIRRFPNPHLTFGKSTHHCLGAPLARLEASIALGAMLARFPTLQLARTTPLEPIDPQFFVDGFKALPVRFTSEHAQAR
jgi:cytochrome P450